MSNCCDRPTSRPMRQRGEILLESLIAVLLTSLIAGGLVQVQARLMQDQRDTKVERLVVGQLRNHLQATGTGLCSASQLELPLTNDVTRPASIACTSPGPLEVGVAGTALSVDAPPRIDLSVTAQDLEFDDRPVDESAVDLLVSSHQ